MISEERGKIIKEAELFFFPKASNQAVLLIHGFSETPFHLQRFGKFLWERGFGVYGVRLAGHGSNLEIFARTTYRDWQESCRLGFKRLAVRYRSVAIVGNSFGGNLGVNLAVCYPQEVKKIVTIGTPLELYRHRLTRLMVRFARPIKKYHRKSWLTRIGNVREKDNSSYTKIPLTSLQEFFQFIERFTLQELPRVTQPTLIIHSKNDIVVPPKNAYNLFSRLGSREKTIHWIENSYHNPFLDYPEQDLFERIFSFLR